MFGLKDRIRRGLLEAMGIPFTLGAVALVLLVLHQWMDTGA